MFNMYIYILIIYMYMYTVKLYEIHQIYMIDLTANQIVFCFSPTDFNGVAEAQWFPGFLTLLEMADIKMGQRMVDKPVHGAIWAVHVLVDHPRDEV